MKGTTLDSIQLVLESLVRLRAEWQRHPEVIPARCIAEIEAMINAIPSPRETFGVSEPRPEWPADANVRLVQQKLGERAAVGLRKYGVTTERKDLSLIEWLAHLQEELMDAAVYVQAALNHVPVRTDVEPDLIFDQRYRASGLAYDDNTRRFARWWFSHGYLMAKDRVKEASRG